MKHSGRRIGRMHQPTYLFHACCMGVIWSLKPPGQGASQSERQSYRGQSHVAVSSTLEYARWRARTRTHPHALRKRAGKTSSARSSTHLCILGEVRPTGMLLDASGATGHHRPGLDRRNRKPPSRHRGVTRTCRRSLSKVQDRVWGKA